MANSRVITKWYCTYVVCLTISLLMVLAESSLATEEKGGQEEKNDTITAIQEYTIEQKEQAVFKAQELMESLDKKMSVWERDLEMKVDSLKESSKETFQKSKKQFKEQRAELAVWIDKMQNSSGEAWGEVKLGFSDAYDAFVTAWNRTEEEMSKESKEVHIQEGQPEQEQQ